jgi:DNA-binding CsgD family transcriptional regulator
MAQLDVGDLQDVLGIGQSVLECDSMIDLQEQAVRQGMRSLCSTSGVYFNVHRCGDRYHFVEGTTKGVGESVSALWLRSYQDDDPCAQRFLETVDSQSGKVVVSTQLIERGGFCRSLFFNEFLKPHDIYHVLVIGLSRNGLPIGLFGFHRPPGALAFSEADIVKAKLLAPHLSAAVQKVRALDLLEERHRILELMVDDLADDSLAILDDNLQATFFHRNTELAVAPFFSAADFPADVIARCRRMRSALNWDRHVTPVEQLELDVAGRRWNFSIRSISGCKSGSRFMVRVRQLRGANDRAASRLEEMGLTRREIEIAQLVAMGMSNAGIAEQLCISIRTVQNHLRAIYDKAGIHNRASLVSCVYGNRPAR